jgi:DNA-binding CsgD family transcriptional regulator
MNETEKFETLMRMHREGKGNREISDAINLHVNKVAMIRIVLTKRGSPTTRELAQIDSALG